MAEDLDEGQSAGGGTDEASGGSATRAAEPSLLLNSHYIKDLSFENPNAPLIYGELQKGPQINVSIDVDLSHLQDRLYEIVLKLHVDAKVGDQVAFMVELDMAGLATVGEQVAADETDRLLLTEVPRYLFPFARAVVGDMTRDGGFPPLLINPISFEELYRNRQERDAELAQAGGL